MQQVGREVGVRSRVHHVPAQAYRGVAETAFLPSRPTEPPNRIDRPSKARAMRRDRSGRSLARDGSRRSPQLQSWVRVLRGRAALVAAAICGALAFTTVTDGGRTARVVSPLLPEFDAVLGLAGFGLDQVAIAGHRFTTDIDILDALDLPNARTWAQFDSEQARMRIERLPWLATATLTRRYPGRLDVKVVERKAVAVWQHGSRETLIDITGRNLSDIRPGTVAGLPRYQGEGADVEAAGLAAIVARHPEIQSRMKIAERVAGRRWSLHLDNGTTLHLPPDREALVLDGLLSRTRLLRLVTEPGRVVDLRAPGRIAIRLQSSASGPVASPPQAGGRLVKAGE